MDQETHERFLGLLDSSRAAVLIVADWLCGKGMNVMLPYYSRSPDHQVRSQHRDGGDIMALNKDISKAYRIEVRHHQNESWTGPGDWPERNVYGAIVGPLHCHNDKTYAWFHLNKDMTHYYMVKPGSRAHWSTRAVMDKPSGEKKDNYFVPIEHVEFGRFSDE